MRCEGLLHAKIFMDAIPLCLLLNKQIIQSKILCYYRPNKCGSSGNKHNGIAFIAMKSQYYSISRYKNIKRRIIKCNSDMYFDKQSVNQGTDT
jgi:hypothetical protein